MKKLFVDDLETNKIITLHLALQKCSLPVITVLS